MGNIYIETDENFRVTKIHRMPFDPNNGMGYTREELEKKGFFVEQIPDPINKVGKRSVAMYNPDIKSVYYEYISIPMSDKERIELLEGAVNFVMKRVILTTAMISNDSDIYQVSESEEKAAKYLAYQIIADKLELKDCIENFPQYEKIIKDILTDNGIQA